MGRPAGWMKELTGRTPMKSPGAPALRREIERAFWREIAKGITTEAAAAAVGVSQAAEHDGSAKVAACLPRHLSTRLPRDARGPPNRQDRMRSQPSVLGSSPINPLSAG